MTISYNLITKANRINDVNNKKCREFSCNIIDLIATPSKRRRNIEYFKYLFTSEFRGRRRFQLMNYDVIVFIENR